MVYEREDNNSIEKPIKFVRKVLDENGDVVRNMYISDDCELYDIDEWDSHNFYSESKQSDLPVKIDSHGRRYAAINDNSSNHHRTQHLARIARRAFDDPKMSNEFYRTHQVDHIDPSIPLSNNISNLEWVTPQENMYRAGKTGVMLKKYSKELIGEICEALIESKETGEKRKDIAKRFGVNENLIYDISIGKSHKSVSENYIDKGFEYKTPSPITREERIQQAHEICRLMQDTDLTNTQIAKKLSVNRSNVDNIRNLYTYKDISSQYNIKRL